MASGLQVLFGEFAKLIGNRPRRSQHDRSVSDCIPSETIADHVDSAVSRPARHPSLGAGPAFFIFKPQRKFQLHLPVLLKMRHGDRQQRYGLLLRMIGERRTNELFGDFGKGSGRSNGRIKGYGACDRVEVGETNANCHSPTGPGFRPKPARDPVRKMTQRGSENFLFSRLLAER